jgi:hypothetical protein
MITRYSAPLIIDSSNNKWWRAAMRSPYLRRHVSIKSPFPSVSYQNHPSVKKKPYLPLTMTVGIECSISMGTAAALQSRGISHEADRPLLGPVGRKSHRSAFDHTQHLTAVGVLPARNQHLPVTTGRGVRARAVRLSKRSALRTIQRSVERGIYRNDLSISCHTIESQTEFHSPVR